MFSKKSAVSEERLTELLADSLERESRAHRMVIDVLVDQVEYLRAQVAGSAYIAQSARALNPSALPPMVMGAAPHLSEEEEELYALASNGRLTPAEVERLEAELGLDISDPLTDD